MNGNMNATTEPLNAESVANTGQQESFLPVDSQPELAVADGEADTQETMPDPEDYCINFPEDVTLEGVDDALLGRFKSFCSTNRLSPEQAQQAVDFYLTEQAAGLEKGMDWAEESLRQNWKGAYEQRVTIARQACSQLDNRLQGRLTPLLHAGLGNHPVFIEMMSLIGESITEDSLGGKSSAVTRPMSTEEFLRTEVFRNR